MLQEFVLVARRGQRLPLLRRQALHRLGRLGRGRLPIQQHQVGALAVGGHQPRPLTQAARRPLRVAWLAILQRRLPRERHPGQVAARPGRQLPLQRHVQVQVAPRRDHAGRRAPHAQPLPRLHPPGHAVAHQPQVCDLGGLFHLWLFHLLERHPSHFHIRLGPRLVGRVQLLAHIGPARLVTGQIAPVRHRHPHLGAHHLPPPALDQVADQQVLPFDHRRQPAVRRHGLDRGCRCRLSRGLRGFGCHGLHGRRCRRRGRCGLGLRPRRQRRWPLDGLERANGCRPRLGCPRPGGDLHRLRQLVGQVGQHPRLDAHVPGQHLAQNALLVHHVAGLRPLCGIHLGAGAEHFALAPLHRLPK